MWVSVCKHHDCLHYSCCTYRQPGSRKTCPVHPRLFLSHLTRIALIFSHACEPQITHLHPNPTCSCTCSWGFGLAEYQDSERTIERHGWKVTKIMHQIGYIRLILQRARASDQTRTLRVSHQIHLSSPTRIGSNRSTIVPSRFIYGPQRHFVWHLRVAWAFRHELDLKPRDIFVDLYWRAEIWHLDGTVILLMKPMVPDGVNVWIYRALCEADYYGSSLVTYLVRCFFYFRKISFNVQAAYISW